MEITLPKWDQVSKKVSEINPENPHIIYALMVLFIVFVLYLVPGIVLKFAIVVGSALGLYLLKSNIVDETDTPSSQTISDVPTISDLLNQDINPRTKLYNNQHTGDRKLISKETNHPSKLLSGFHVVQPPMKSTSLMRKSQVTSQRRRGFHEKIIESKTPVEPWNTKESLSDLVISQAKNSQKIQS